MTVREFCLHKTQAHELCAITDCGYIVATVWIDYEDLFAINEIISKMEVKNDKWDTLEIINDNGIAIEVPCHFIEC